MQPLNKLAASYFRRSNDGILNAGPRNIKINLITPWQNYF